MAGGSDSGDDDGGSLIYIGLDNVERLQQMKKKLGFSTDSFFMRWLLDIAECSALMMSSRSKRVQEEHDSNDNNIVDDDDDDEEDGRTSRCLGVECVGSTSSSGDGSASAAGGGGGVYINSTMCEVEGNGRSSGMTRVEDDRDRNDGAHEEVENVEMVKVKVEEVEGLEKGVSEHEQSRRDDDEEQDADMASPLQLTMASNTPDDFSRDIVSDDDDDRDDGDDEEVGEIRKNASVIPNLSSASTIPTCNRENIDFSSLYNQSIGGLKFSEFLKNSPYLRPNLWPQLIPPVFPHSVHQPNGSGGVDTIATSATALSPANFIGLESVISRLKQKITSKSLTHQTTGGVAVDSSVVVDNDSAQDLSRKSPSSRPSSFPLNPNIFGTSAGAASLNNNLLDSPLSLSLSHNISASSSASGLTSPLSTPGNGGDEFPCRICGKIFPAKHRLRVHERTHSGEKPYQCHICKRSFSDRGNMKRHVYLHSGAKPYVCQICGAKFTLKHNMKAHVISVHAPERYS